jgi:carboxymethylenebutenolidase
MVDIALPHYLARPVEPTARGVIVAHEGMGITPQMLGVARRLAAEAYVAIVPDFFFRTGGPVGDDHWEHIRAVTNEQLHADLASAIEVLRADGVTSIGVTGFCMGGRFAYEAARWADDLGVDAAVSFYGDIAQDLGEVRCPTLLLFGARDEWISDDDVAATRAVHGDAVIVYPEAGHGFMRDGTPNHHPASADDGWARLLAFFDQRVAEGAARG